MITDFLLDHRWITPMVLLGFVCLGPFVGARLVGHPRLTAALLALSILAVAVLTLWPTGRTVASQCQLAWMLPTPRRVELFANMVLFVAPAALATIITARPIVALAVVTLLSAAVELTQAFITALGRSCDSSDLINNAIGASIGVLLGIAALRLARRREGTAAGSTAH